MLSSKTPPLLSALALAASLAAPLPDLAASVLRRRDRARRGGIPSLLQQPPFASVLPAPLDRLAVELSQFAPASLLFVAARWLCALVEGRRRRRSRPKLRRTLSTAVAALKAASAADASASSSSSAAAAAHGASSSSAAINGASSPSTSSQQNGAPGSLRREEERREEAEPLEPEPEELEGVFPPLPDFATAARGPRAAEVGELRESLHEAFRVVALPTARFDAAGAELMRFAAAAGVSLEKRKTIESSPSASAEEAAQAKGEGGGEGEGGEPRTPTTPATPRGESHEAVAAALEAAATAVIDSEEHAARHLGVPSPSSDAAASSSAVSASSPSSASASTAAAAAPKVGVLAGVIGAGKKRRLSAGRRAAQRAFDLGDVRWAGRDRAGRPVLAVSAAAAAGADSDSRGARAADAVWAVMACVDDAARSSDADGLEDPPPTPAAAAAAAAAARPPPSPSAENGRREGGEERDAAPRPRRPACAPAADGGLVCVLDCRGASPLAATRRVRLVKDAAQALSERYPGRLFACHVVGLPAALRWMVPAVAALPVAGPAGLSLSSASASSSTSMIPSRVRLCAPGDAALPACARFSPPRARVAAAATAAAAAAAPAAAAPRAADPAAVPSAFAAATEDAPSSSPAPRTPATPAAAEEGESSDGDGGDDDASGAIRRAASAPPRFDKASLSAATAPPALPRLALSPLNPVVLSPSRGGDVDDVDDVDVDDKEEGGREGGGGGGGGGKAATTSRAPSGPLSAASPFSYAEAVTRYLPAAAEGQKKRVTIPEPKAGGDSGGGDDDGGGKSGGGDNSKSAASSSSPSSPRKKHAPSPRGTAPSRSALRRRSRFGPTPEGAEGEEEEDGEATTTAAATAPAVATGKRSGCGGLHSSHHRDNDGRHRSSAPSLNRISSSASRGDLGADDDGDGDGDDGDGDQGAAPSGREESSADDDEEEEEAALLRARMRKAFRRKRRSSSVGSGRGGSDEHAEAAALRRIASGSRSPRRRPARGGVIDDDDDDNDGESGGAPLSPTTLRSRGRLAAAAALALAAAALGGMGRTESGRGARSVLGAAARAVRRGHNDAGASGGRGGVGKNDKKKK